MFSAIGFVIHHLVACWSWIPGCDLYNTASGVIDTITKIAGELLKLFTDTTGFFKDVFTWLRALLFPQEVVDMFDGKLSSGSTSWVGTRNYTGYYQIYQGVLPAGLLFAGLGMAARVVKIVFDQRAPASVLLVDVLPRFVIAYGALLGGFFSNPDGSSGGILPFIVDAGTTLGTGLSEQILTSSPGSSVLSAVLNTFGNLVTGGSLFIFLGLIPVALMLLYALFLMVMRAVMLAFAIAVAPLCIGVAVFDHRNKFVQWWVDLFMGATLIPVVLWTCIAVSLKLALALIGSGVSPLNGLSALVILFVGFWMSGKVVHQLTWRHFSHGNLQGALMAGFTAVSTIPQLAAKGIFAAKGMGANVKEGGFADKVAKAAYGLQGFDPFPNGQGGGGGGAGAGAGGGGGGGGGGKKVGGLLAAAAATVATGGAAAPAMAGAMGGAAGGAGGAMAGGAMAGGAAGGAAGGGAAAAAKGASGAAGGGSGFGLGGGSGAGGGGGASVGRGFGGGSGYGSGGGAGGSSGGGAPSGPPRSASPGGGSGGGSSSGGGGRSVPFGGRALQAARAMSNQNFSSLVNNDAESADHYDHFITSRLDDALEAAPAYVWSSVMEQADENGDQLDPNMTFDQAKEYFAGHLSESDLDEFGQAHMGEYLNADRYAMDSYAASYMGVA